jgi:GNAT superfamily N-acetyltransferase
MIEEKDVFQVTPAFLNEAAAVLCDSFSAERPPALAMSTIQAVRELEVVAPGRTRTLLLHASGTDRVLCIVDFKTGQTATTARCMLHASGNCRKSDLQTVASRALQLAQKRGCKSIQLCFPDNSGLGPDLERLGFGIRSATIELYRQLGGSPGSVNSPPHPVEFIAFQDACPHEFEEAYCALKTDLSRSVRGDRRSDIVKIDTVRLRADESAALARGTPVVGMLAIDPATRRLIGLADFLCNTPNAGCVMHQDTIVTSDMRGQGVGTLLKVSTLGWLAATFPQLGYTWTRNNEKNRAILDMNSRLGYHLAARLPWMEYLG